MDHKVAEFIIVTVNEPHFQESIEAYVKDRKKSLHAFLETEKDPLAIYRIQGQIQELNQLLSLKDRVNSESRR